MKHISEKEFKVKGVKTNIMLEKISEHKRLILYVIILVGIVSFLVAAYINQANHIASTPPKTWRLFLLALENEDIQQIQTLTSPRVFEYISTAESQDLFDMPFMAKYWANPGVRWRVDDENTMSASVPTPSGSFIFTFIRESNEWKLDWWVAPDT